MKITKRQFEVYEEVRMSGVTNMFDVPVVMDLSGLNRETCIEIMKTYKNLMVKYPDIIEGK